MAKRVILDTNLWISFLITKNYSGLNTYLQDGKVSLIFSEELLAEFLAVAKRPKLKKYFPESSISSLMTIMETFGEIIDVTSDIKICRDVKDNFLLNLAKDSKADFLVTGDKDLLVLEKVANTKIVSFSDFESILKTF